MRINGVAAGNDYGRHSDHDRHGSEAALRRCGRRTLDPQRFDIANIRSARRSFRHDYRLLSASTTLIRIACRAGSHPPSSPIAAAKPRASTTVRIVTRKLIAIVENVMVLANVVEIPSIGSARITPTTPAADARISASSRNESITAPPLNPRARSVPISIVRAETAAYIVFIAAKIAPIAMITATTIPSACIRSAVTV